MKFTKANSIKDKQFRLKLKLMDGDKLLLIMKLQEPDLMYHENNCAQFKGNLERIFCSK